MADDSPHPDNIMKDEMGIVTDITDNPPIESRPEWYTSFPTETTYDSDGEPFLAKDDSIAEDMESYRQFRADFLASDGYDVTHFFVPSPNFRYFVCNLLRPVDLAPGDVFYDHCLQAVRRTIQFLNQKRGRNLEFGELVKANRVANTSLSFYATFTATEYGEKQTYQAQVFVPLHDYSRVEIWEFRAAAPKDGRVRIEKFNGTDFAWWKMQIEALLGECDLDMVLEEKPDGMDKAAEAIWDSKDKKARGKITLALTRSVAFNIMKETTARGMLTALSNMYEKPSAGNRVFLMRELFMMRMNEGSPVADHINEVNSILSRLSSVGMKFDDDTQAVILLSSLPDSWSGFVTTVTETAGTGNLKFDRIRDSVLGEDIRRRNASGGSTSGLLNVSRGREAVAVTVTTGLELGGASTVLSGY
ncbi:unnamed protein product [Cuscuta campestris]|uniref:Reverse transcriptase Ty1/copia-type domain-containing protein n=1 Tax=Cuscuta campestris TaxID=132261 RepID=A0A484K640_9ASTE|nr:unnamed protein product [Cuscuta campestris]